MAVGVPKSRKVPPPEFYASYTKWASHGIQTYEFTVQTLCQCDIRPIHVYVLNGVVSKAEFATSAARTPLAASDMRYRLLTIDAIFSDIAKSYANGYDKIQANYDAKYGIPIEYFLDRDAKAFDDEATVRVSDFVPATRG